MKRYSFFTLIFLGYISTIVVFCGCDIGKLLSNSSNIAQQTTGTWEGNIEADSFLGNQKQIHPVIVRINLSQKPYFIEFKIAEEIKKIENDKIAIHNNDNALEYFTKNSNNPAYIVLIDSKTIELKGNGKTLNLKKIISAH